jgi:hypothetical protein
VLALNFGGKLLQSIAFLSVLTVISGGLLIWFHKLTSRWASDAAPEGLLSRDPSRETRAIPFVSFALTVLYLPLSTISVHAIVSLCSSDLIRPFNMLQTWSSDFWPIDNPYTGLDGTQRPEIPPLGPSSVFRDPHDFCWTTTMRKDEINYAPAAIILAIFTLIFVSFMSSSTTYLTQAVDDILVPHSIGKYH